MENIEDVILELINMPFSECLEFLVYGFASSLVCFIALFFLIWGVVQIWGVFKDISSH